MDKHIKNKESGASLIEILISLVIASFVFIALAELMANTAVISTENRSTMGTMRQVQRLSQLFSTEIMDAGYGMPSLSVCGAGGVTGVNDNNISTLLPIAPFTESNTQYGGTQTVNNDGLTVMYGSNVQGAVGQTTIQKLSSTSSSTINLNNVNGIQSGDVIITEVPRENACYLQEVTNVQQTPTRITVASAQNYLNPSNSFSGFNSYRSGAGLSTPTAAEFSSGQVVNLGQGWRLTTFYLVANTYGTDDLMMRTEQINGSSLSPTQSTNEVMSNLLAMKVQVGIGTQNVTSWESASSWQASPPNYPNIMALRVGFIVVSQNATQGIQTPTSVSMMGQTYSIPASLQGHVVYPVVFTYNVRNNAWNQ